MIRVFNANDRDFTSNGNAVIVPIKAKVKNNLNGDFYLDLTCESRFYDYLTQGDIIVAPTPQGEQAFRIGNSLQRKGERITLKANHVYYDSLNYVIADSYAFELTCKQALNHFNNATDNKSPFTMDSNINTVNNFRCVRKSLNEAIATVIERWGGYLVRDNWKVSVLQSIGKDYGITIKYAKNLTELTASYDFSGVCTKLLPVGRDGILLPELYVYANKQYEIPYTKVLSIDQDLNEKDFPSEEAYTQAVIADLRIKAQKIVNSSCYPVVTYTLKGKPELIQDIGDIIQVKDERIGVNITTQVIGYEWDILTKEYSSLTFGNFGNSLNDLVGKVNDKTKATVNEAVGEFKGDMKDSINKIYDLLQNSYVYYRGYDILLLDKIPASTAVNILRFSNNGISVSNTGINGTYSTVYDLNTKALSVPTLYLNGSNLQTTINNLQTAIANKQDKLIAGENITIERNKISAKYTGLQWWKETPTKLYRDGTKEGSSGLANYLKPSTNEVGNWQNGNGWFRCMVTRLKGNVRNVIMGYSINNADRHPIITYASTEPLDFEWGWSNNTFNPPYGVTTWADKDTYPIPREGYDHYFGWSMGTVTYEGKTWYILLIDTYTWAGGTSMSSVDGIESFIHFWENNPQSLGLTLLQTAQAVPYTTVRTEIGTEDYAFKYGSSDKTYASIDTDGNAVFKELTTDAGTLTDQMEAKQDNLIAGANIQIGADGKTISATNTTYEEFDGSNAGLVPAVETQSGKVLSDDGTWVEGGTHVEANPSDSATSTLLKLKVDGTTYEISGGGGGGSFIGLTKSQYDALPTSEKEDTSKLYLVQEGGGVPTVEDLIMTSNDWSIYREGSMTITWNNDEIVFDWRGGLSIGGNIVKKVAIPANASKIKFKITTGSSYSTTIDRFRVFIGVRTTYQTGVIMPYYSINDWLAKTDFYTNNAVWEGELDLSSVNVDTYLYITAHGWDATVNYLEVVIPSSAEITRHTYWNNAKWSQWASNRITYGTTTPTGDANDGDLYILLDSNNSKQGEYLYMNNAWAQIE